jgi:serine/threonine protein kinase
MKTKGPPPLAVKRGEIGKDEAALIDKVGKADLGPKLVSGQVSVSKFAKPGETLHAGRLAMTLVPGRDLNDRKAEDKVGNTTVGDAFWKARGDLHRLGVAHNDMHPGNVFVDEKGKGRFVDMGLAQNNPKAALSEAMGAFEPPKAWNVPTRVNSIGEPDRGDWQVKRFRDMTGVRSKFPSDAPETYRKINSNRIDLENRMRKDGLSNQEIGQIMGDGIRNKDSVYRNGAWAKISDEQAKSYINDLYKGV